MMPCCSVYEEYSLGDLLVDIIVNYLGKSAVKSAHTGTHATQAARLKHTPPT
jgi:hypothetical protein